MVICITGASSGIGEAAALRLAREEGATLVLVARREERLRAVAERCGADATWIAVDLTADDAPERVRSHLVERHDGRLDVLVNNAGSSWPARFAEGGYENVRRTMTLNFDAPVRLTEALLPLLRADGGGAVVNVGSTAGRVARARTGAYSASKFALAGWTDALWSEERRHGVHVGLVQPGFVVTEGFPQRELTESMRTRWAVSRPEVVAEAIAACALDGVAERYSPRGYWLAAAARILAPRLVRRVLSGPGSGRMTPATNPDA